MRNQIAATAPTTSGADREGTVPSLGIWSEFLPYSRVNELLPVLAQYKASLYLAIQHDRIGDRDLAALLRNSSALGVSVNAWILLPDEAGYWPNSHNVDKVIQQVDCFVEWVESMSLQVPWIVIDMEPSLKYTKRLHENLSFLAPFRSRRTLREAMGHHEFTYATHRYSQMVSNLQARGYKVMVVTFPVILDNLQREYNNLQKALHIPVTQIKWDKISLLTYRTSFQHIFKVKVSPYLVYSYLREAIAKLPCPVAGALGVIGSVEKIQTPGGFKHPADLIPDIAAARYAGVDEIQLFSLDGMCESHSLDAWLSTINSAAACPPRAWRDVLVRKCLQWGDQLLE